MWSSDDWLLILAIVLIVAGLLVICWSNRFVTIGVNPSTHFKATATGLLVTTAVNINGVTKTLNSYEITGASLADVKLVKNS